MGANGYIVQHFRRQFDSENDFLKDISYYEAWQVEDGKVKESSECDDVFAIGHPSNSLDMLKYEHGKCGRVIFSGDVYWIPSSSELSEIINSWEETTVKDANGLKASYTFNELSEKYFVFQRPDFIHKWDLRSKKHVFDIVTDLLIAYYSNYHDSTWERNVNLAIEDIFNESIFSDIKEKAKGYIIYAIKNFKGE